MLIRIFYFFLNRSIIIIMDYCYNVNPTGSLAIKCLNKDDFIAKISGLNVIS